MPIIQTVLGKIPPKSLGFCHCHEHLMISKGKSFTINEALCIDDYQRTLAELFMFKQAGGRTIVDAQPVGCNRMPAELASLSRDSGVHIIASTGFHKIIFYPDNHWVFQLTEAEITRIFLHELTTGMYIDCDIFCPKEYINLKAGIIKTAFDTCGLTEQYKKLFHAAITASNNTGTPIMVHIEQNANPLVLVDFLKKEGANFKKTIFCHMDRTCADITIHKKICDEGIYMEYDTIGRFKYHSDEREAEIFREMINAGYENQLLFSLDTTRARLKSYNPDAIGLDYIINSFIPLLKKAGISSGQIYKISHTNCKKALSIVHKKGLII